MTAEITGEKRGAPEGVWVQDGGIEVPRKYSTFVDHIALVHGIILLSLKKAA